MSRFKYVGGFELGDSRNWQEIVPGVKEKDAGGSADIMSDIKGFWEPGASETIEGRFIEGRAALRAYERENGVRQIGDQIGSEGK